MALLEKVTGGPPEIRGTSIFGCGVHRYTYESGRTGEAALVGSAIRGREQVVYVDLEGDRQQSLSSQLGEHRMAKCCLYFERMADLDKAVLEELIARWVAEVRRRHG